MVVEATTDVLHRYPCLLTGINGISLLSDANEDGRSQKAGQETLHEVRGVRLRVKGLEDFLVTFVDITRGNRG